MVVVWEIENCGDSSSLLLMNNVISMVVVISRVFSVFMGFFWGGFGWIVGVVV